MGSSGQPVVSSVAPIQVKVQSIKAGSAVSNDPSAAYVMQGNQNLVPPQQEVQQKPQHLSPVNVVPLDRKGELENKAVSENGPILNVLTDAVDQKSKKETVNENLKINDAAHLKSKKENIHEKSKINEAVQHKSKKETINEKSKINDPVQH